MATGRNRPGMAMEAASAGRSGPRYQRHLLAAMQIGGRHRERNFQFGKIGRDGFGQKLRAEFFCVDLSGLAECAGKQIGERAGA